ncbi:MAG: hypothetical protein U1F37_01975 [Alphaproteobacteria bacterium]
MLAPKCDWWPSGPKSARVASRPLDAALPARRRAHHLSLVPPEPRFASSGRDEDRYAAPALRDDAEIEIKIAATTSSGGRGRCGGAHGRAPSRRAAPCHPPEAMKDLRGCDARAWSLNRSAKDPVSTDPAPLDEKIGFARALSAMTTDEELADSAAVSATWRCRRRLRDAEDAYARARISARTRSASRS